MMSSIGLHIALLLVSLSSVMCGSPVDRVGGQCLTVGGAQTGVPCVLPFKARARGTTYTECTKAGGFDTPWCSTKVDANGDTVLGNWGDCPTDDPDCYPSQATTEAAPMETTAQAGGDCLTVGGAQVGVPCVFPFKARGNTYTSCTFAGGFSTPWCSTKVDENGDTVLGNWGDCPMDDPTCPNDATTLAPETSPVVETSPADITSPAVEDTSPMDETSPAETSPAETSLAETSPAETSPAETSPAQTSPAETSLAETSPAETSPAETSPAETSPAETSPAETTPAATSPAETSPAETSPAETSPAETSPAETSLAETSLAETSPAETSPAETSPAETSPAETSPAESSPAETSPAETSPAETSPAVTETSPAETSPAETSPAETSPAETSPAETSPAETSPAETSPAETSPAETSPAETSPAETSPAETSPAETSPAETSPDATTVAPCMTVSGAQVGVPCIFPFITRETTYTSCTVAGGYSIPWCATKVDNSGTIVMGNWGECALDDPNCPNDITTEAPTTESTTAEIPPDGGAPVRKINFF